MLCGWGVNAGMVCEWVAGKTEWAPCYHGPYLSALAMGLSHNRVLYKCPITLLYFIFTKCTAKRRLIVEFCGNFKMDLKTHYCKWPYNPAAQFWPTLSHRVSDRSFLVQPRLISCKSTWTGIDQSAHCEWGPVVFQFHVLHFLLLFLFYCMWLISVAILFQLFQSGLFSVPVFWDVLIWVQLLVPVPVITK